MSDPLTADVLALAREVRALATSGLFGRDDAEKLAVRLADAVIAQTCDEIDLQGNQNTFGGFWLQYVAQKSGETGPINVILDGKHIVAEVESAFGHWLEDTIILVPGRPVSSPGLRLFGRHLTNEEVFRLAHRDKSLPFFYRNLTYTARDESLLPGSLPAADWPTTITCATCGHSSPTKPCYRCGAT